ncbi:Rpn family recombination-promoting nuclease/putative transposase [Yersinia massiliensis]|uniref:ISNCY family transposase n=1 Tax=Yersinia massiliensis TaxID=419257 RepID=A0ABM6UVL4_9GAMM|nr:Rpn family recombination-promoting nuclease/putative transposase [Yersinia massiliensis]AVX38810.1 ISNCY family transposase [Yersinia massiliensis]QKJ09592.1 Rpn family recombination-promoting nuclease/putative transposase [Yersinia massiliensis]
MKTISAPHDAIFKQFLTHLQTARDFLEIHLPPELRQICDLNTLQLESGSFVENDLKAYYSDVLYSLKTQMQDGYIYALIEHQSSPDKQMAFRLMRYAIAAMQRHLEAGNEKLPLVIPILFYHGQVTPYPYSMNWLQAFSSPIMAGKLYSSDFPLVDVTVIPDDEIMTHRSIAMLELLQKHIRRRDLSKLSDRLVILLSRGYNTDDQLVSLINYMLQDGEDSVPKTFIWDLARRSPQHKELLMSIADKLKQEGHQEGAQETALRIASALLASGVDRAIVRNTTGLSEKELAQLCH